MDTKATRIEKDFLGEKEVPVDAYYGVQTMRAVENFPITGYQIDVYREINEEDLDDIYLDEFNDEIDQWVIDAFKAIGLDTAKEVLGTSKEDLLKRTDLEEETIDEVLRILAAEFEND